MKAKNKLLIIIFSLLALSIALSVSSSFTNPTIRNGLVEWEVNVMGVPTIFSRSPSDMYLCIKAGKSENECVELLLNQTYFDVINHRWLVEFLNNASVRGDLSHISINSFEIKEDDIASHKLQMDIQIARRECENESYFFWNNNTQTCYINEFRKCIYNGTWFWNESSNICAQTQYTKCRENKSMQWVKVWNDKTEQYDEYCEYSAWREWYWKRQDCYNYKNRSMWWDNSTNTCRTAGGLMVTER